MTGIVSVIPLGNGLLAQYDDGTRQQLYPLPNGMYVPGLQGDDGSAGEIGDDGGDGGSDDTIDPGTTGDLYNPWKNTPVSVGGTWDDHIARTGRGGTDYPLAYGTDIPAPAAGTLHVTGGAGEYAAGYVGSAGRRSILYLNKSFARKKPRGRNEANGPMVAIVFQHQSQMGAAAKYAKGDIIGKTGASANGSDYGGAVHLHVHGLDRSGARLDYLKFF